jgi:hypothetical protein
VVRKIDDESAFAFYVGLGFDRSYGAVARKFNVCSRAIRKAAKRGDWLARLAKIEQEAQVRSDKKLAETRADVRERHLRMIKVVATRGLQAIQKYEIEDAADGVRAIEAAIKWERLIMGENSEQIGVSIQEQTRREVESFLVGVNEPDDDPDDDDDEKRDAPE